MVIYGEVNMKKKDDLDAKLKKLYDLCVNIYAHNELDCEVTLGGNGVNCSEASTVADEIQEIIGKISEKDIQKEVKILKETYGIED